MDLATIFEWFAQGPGVRDQGLPRPWAKGVLS
jgi:hypothetical protein